MICLTWRQQNVAVTDRTADDRSALDLVAQVAELLPRLTTLELDELADAVEDLTDAIAFSIETATITESAAESGTDPTEPE